MAEILKLFFNSYTFKVVTLGCILLGVVSAIIGTFAVLKKESLLGDGVSHASLAGICLAFLITGKKELYILLLGALIIGLICIFLIHYTQLKSKVKFDSAIALMLSTFFGLGLVLLTYLKKIPGAKKAGLNRFIFGQASTLVVKDIYLIIESHNYITRNPPSTKKSKKILFNSLTSNENTDHGNSGGPVFTLRNGKQVVIGLCSGANNGSDGTHRKGRIIPIGAAFN